MKVAHIIGKMKNGGVEAVVFTYLRFMDKDGMQIDVLYDSDSIVPPPEDLVKSGVNFIEIPPYQKMIPYMKAVRRICIERGYDIIHSHINTLSVFPLRAAKRAGIRHRICHNHSTSSKIEKKRNIVKGILKPFAKHYATDYAACSELSGRWMYGDRVFDSGRVKVFNNAINTEKYKFSALARDEIRRKFNIGDSFLVGHVGRFVTQKNHGFLIDIFAALSKKRPDAMLMLLGEGERLGEIKEKVRKLNLEEKVRFIGLVDDVEIYYSAFDAFLLPSLYEGLPVVAMEAQSSGLDCIVSDKVTRECAVTDLVRFIPLSDSADKWAESLVACLAKDRLPYNEIMKNSKYNIEYSARDMKEYYCNILNSDNKYESEEKLK